jgi:hypothetical protein
MKCVAQIPNPVVIADTASQTWRIWPEAVRACRSRLMAAKDAKAQMTAASPTSHKSWAVAMQL